MTKKITDTVDEANAILGHVRANRDNVDALWAWNGTDLGLNLKTKPSDFLDDVGAIVAALAARATTATAEHGAVVLDVGEHSAFASEAVKKAHGRAAKCRSAIQNCYGTAVAQRTFGKGKTPETAEALAVFLERAVKQLEAPHATWTVECPEVLVSPAAMAKSLDQLRVEMQAEAKKNDENRGGVSVKKTKRDNVGTRLRNGRNGVRGLAEGVLTLLGDLDGAKHIALHRHVSPAVGANDTPPVPPPPVGGDKPPA